MHKSNELKLKSKGTKKFFTSDSQKLKQLEIDHLELQKKHLKLQKKFIELQNQVLLLKQHLSDGKAI